MHVPLLPNTDQDADSARPLQPDFVGFARLSRLIFVCPMHVEPRSSPWYARSRFWRLSRIVLPHVGDPRALQSTMRCFEGSTEDAFLPCCIRCTRLNAIVWVMNVSDQGCFPCHSSRPAELINSISWNTGLIPCRSDRSLLVLERIPVPLRTPC